MVLLCLDQLDWTFNVNTKLKSPISAQKELLLVVMYQLVLMEMVHLTLLLPFTLIRTMILKLTKIRLFWLAKQSFTMLQCKLQSVDLNLLFLTVLSLTTMLENLTTSMLANVLTNTLEQSKLVNLTLPSFDSVILLFNLHPAMLLKQMKSLLVLFSSATIQILIRHVNLHRLVLVNEDQHPNGQKMQPYLKSKHNFHILNNF